MWNVCPSCLNYQTIYNFCSVLWSWPLKKVVFTIKCPIMATLLLPSHCSVIAYTDGYALCLQSVIEKAWLCWETGNSHQNICRDWVDDTPQKKFYIMKKVDCIIFAWRLIYGWWHQKRIAWYSEKKMETVSSPRLIYIHF